MMSDLPEDRLRQHLRDVKMGRVNIHKAVFEAGFKASAAGFYRIPPAELQARMQRAWKEYCGVNT